MTDTTKNPIISVKNLVKLFPIKEGIVRQSVVGNVHAVDDVTFDVYEGETLGLVGESGCGKTTAGRMLLHLLEPTSGSVVINDQDITRLGKDYIRIKAVYSILVILIGFVFFTFSYLIPSGFLPIGTGSFLDSVVDNGYVTLSGAFLENPATAEVELVSFASLTRNWPDLSFIVAILFLWVFVFTLTALIGVGMFLTSPIYHLLNKRPPDFPTTKTGVYLAVFGVVSEWILMISVIIIGGRSYFPNIEMLIFTLLGTALIIIGGIFWLRIDKNEPMDKKMRKFRKYIQLIFQDPYSSLNPRMTVFDIISEGLDLYGLATSQTEKEQKVLELMDLVGLAPFHIYRYPHEFSGGQRQRIGIARALSVNPQIIIADEPVSALDVSIRAQILNLLDDLQTSLGLTYIIVAHDLSVIRHVSDRVAVMYVGKIMEIASTDDLFQQALHPYTEALMSAVPIPDPTKKKDRIILRGDVPTPINPQPGCRFRDRCNYAKDKCNQEPPLEELIPGHCVACWFSKDIYSIRGVVT